MDVVFGAGFCLRIHPSPRDLVAQALQAVRPGTEVEYEFRKSGNFKNLTDWKPLGPEAPADEGGGPANTYIRRMAALKNATNTLEGYTDMSPREKATAVVKIATKYEKYAVEGLDDADWGTLFDDVFREPGQGG